VLRLPLAGAGLLLWASMGAVACVLLRRRLLVRRGTRISVSKMGVAAAAAAAAACKGQDVCAGAEPEQTQLVPAHSHSWPLEVTANKCWGRSSLDQLC